VGHPRTARWFQAHFKEQQDGNVQAPMCRNIMFSFLSLYHWYYLCLFFILIVIVIIGAPPKHRLTHETDGREITEPFEVRGALIPRATT
jgi:hypothetical protein